MATSRKQVIIQLSEQQERHQAETIHLGVGNTEMISEMRVQRKKKPCLPWGWLEDCKPGGKLTLLKKNWKTNRTEWF